MQHRILTAQQLRQAFHGAKVILGANKAYVDSLNVFPVPDGDTGTNMHLTVTAAIREMDKENTENIAELLKALASGALMGARGNSGVILSQLFRGFSQETVITNFNAHALAGAFQKAADMSYRSVIKPVEGTILTVAKAGAQGAWQKAKGGGDCLEVLEAALAFAQRALEKTPQLLPVLAEAGVVDAGGQGLVYILQGMVAGLKGQDFNSIERQEKEISGVSDAMSLTPSQNLVYRYCTELIIKGSGLREQELKADLLELGDSLLVVGSEEILKLHIHTNRPGLVLEKAGKQGILFDIKIDNMEEQHREMLIEEKPIPQKNLKEMALVAVTVGDGLSAILKSLGVDVVILGGQTMNPSTEDLVAGIREAGARQVLLMPNNKNIILAAKQAQSIVQDEGIQVAVVPTSNFPQSLAALLAYNPEDSLQDNHQRMVEAMGMIKAGEITYAVRDSQYNGLSINSGEVLGLMEGEIVAKGDELEQVAISLVEKLSVDEFELLSIFYGQEIEAEDAGHLKKQIQARFPHLEVEVHSGGQPLYYYIFGLE